jgi:hypothetical protein
MCLQKEGCEDAFSAVTIAWIDCCWCQCIPVHFPSTEKEGVAVVSDYAIDELFLLQICALRLRLLRCNYVRDPKHLKQLLEWKRGRNIT